MLSTVSLVVVGDDIFDSQEPLLVGIYILSPINQLFRMTGRRVDCIPWLSPYNRGEVDFDFGQSCRSSQDGAELRPQ
jgi:hypothetical protein